MCLLTFCPAGIMPDTDALTNGATFNDDGHGYAIVVPEQDRLIIGRGWDAREMIEEFATFREIHPNGPAMFHSRFATDGSVNLLNVHPFTVGGDPRTVLAHNGVMPLRPTKGDLRSDTRIVAEDHIPRAYGTLRRRRARLALERWLTKYNKVVILTVDRRFRENAFILNEQSGTWTKEGIWYSNDGYLPHAGHGYSLMRTLEGVWALGPPKSNFGTVRAKDKVDICWVCDAETDWSLGECPRCGVCFDCGEMPANCMCYVPTKVIDGPVRHLPAVRSDFLTSLSQDE